MPNCKRLIILCCVWIFNGQLFAQTEPDITGLWKGTMYNDTTKQFLKYEIAISENKGKLSGYTHTYFIVDDKEFHGLKKAKIKKKDGKIIVEDLELIANNYPIPPAKGIRQLDVLTLEIKDGVMILSGPFSTNRTRMYSSLTGTVQVTRKTNFKQSALVPHLEELGLADELSFVQEEKLQATIAKANIENARELPVVKNEPKPTEPAKPVAVTTKPAVKKEEVKTVAINKPAVKPVEPRSTTVIEKKKATTVKTNTVAPAKVKPLDPEVVEISIQSSAGAAVKPVQEKSTAMVQAAVDLQNRTIETIQSVNYQSDSLVLTLYDNGEVDGDTVSVLMNGEVIMPGVGLTTNAVRKTIYTRDLPDSVQIVMYAETLGSLPPNTGLLIVNDGTDRYEIRFSGDLKKNAAIVFRRRNSFR